MEPYGIISHSGQFIRKFWRVSARRKAGGSAKVGSEHADAFSRGFFECQMPIAGRNDVSKFPSGFFRVGRQIKHGPCFDRLERIDRNIFLARNDEQRFIGTRTPDCSVGEGGCNQHPERAFPVAE